MKILQLVPAPSGTMLVWESGRKAPVLCFALCQMVEGQDEAVCIYPCTSSAVSGLVIYIKDDARVVL
jgi:hypothetical protein